MKKVDISIAIVGAMFFLVGCESVQKDIYDRKADAIGTDRTVTIYNHYSEKPLKSFRDSKMRFDRNPDGTVSFWLGSKNKKVTTNGIYIIEDN